MREQRARGWMLRIPQHLARRTFFHRFAVGENDDAIGEVAREVIIVRGDQKRAAAIGQLRQRFSQLAAAGRIE